MAIPVIYNLRSVRARWVSAIVAVLGIAGTVGVFVAMLSLRTGFARRWWLRVLKTTPS
jgi:ABC-type lipoprotein release transport system permease subunit